MVPECLTNTSKKRDSGPSYEEGHERRCSSRGKGEEYFGSERTDLLSLIPHRVRRLLDVGCGHGLMGRRLREERGIEVTGIDREERVFAEAKGNLSDIIAGDVEMADLSFEPGYFDCIVYGDILEHLKDPWKVLAEQRRYLRRGGYCIISLPNVGHYRVIRNLVKGNWNYEAAGIMDETHLRFFTPASSRNMLRGAGYEIDQEVRLFGASKQKRLLNKLLGGRLNDLLTEQYILRGKNP